MSLDPCEDAVQVARGILIAVILTASVLAQLSCGGDGDTLVTDTGAQEALIERMTARRWWNGNMLLSSELWTFSADGGVVLEKATDNMDGHLRVERREGVYSVSRWRAADGSFDVACRLTASDVSWTDGVGRASNVTILETRIIPVALGGSGTLLMDGSTYVPSAAR